MKRCPRCGGALEAATLERLSAEEPPVKLDVHGMPAKRCANGHAAPLDEDFMLWFIRELKERAGQIESATEKGALFMKKYLCQCGKPLGARPDRRSAIPLELAYETRRPSGPSSRCLFSAATPAARSFWAPAARRKSRSPSPWPASTTRRASPIAGDRQIDGRAVPGTA